MATTSDQCTPIRDYGISRGLTPDDIDNGKCLLLLLYHNVIKFFNPISNDLFITPAVT